MKKIPKKPIYWDTPCPPSITEDTKLKDLAEFIKEELNYIFHNDPKNNFSPKENLVNTCFTLDYPIVNNNQYPVLKVFRNSSSHQRDSNVRVSNVVITYSITHAMVQKLSGVLNYVDYYMVNILHKYQHKQYQMPYDYTLRSLRDTTDYITSVNSQLNNIAIAYLSWRISIEE